MDHNPDKINFYKSQVTLNTSEASKVELPNPQRGEVFSHCEREGGIGEELG